MSLGVGEHAELAPCVLEVSLALVSGPRHMPSDRTLVLYQYLLILEAWRDFRLQSTLFPRIPQWVG